MTELNNVDNDATVTCAGYFQKHSPVGCTIDKAIVADTGEVISFRRHKEELSNYRPISNLSLISKIIERVVKPRLTDHLTYDTRCYFNVRSKAYISQLNLPHGNRQLKKCKNRKTKK